MLAVAHPEVTDRIRDNAYPRGYPLLGKLAGARSTTAFSSRTPRVDHSGRTYSCKTVPEPRVVERRKKCRA